MTTAEIVGLCSLTVFSLSLTLSIWSFNYNSRFLRASQTARVHEAWWSTDMMQARETVFNACKEHARDGDKCSALVAYFRSPLDTPDPPERTAFSRLIGFFCNLEVCMEAGMLHEKLTARLFGEAHYADYQPLIAAVRDAVAQAEEPGETLPQWLQMTIDLERRFIRQGVRFPSRPGTTA